MEPNPAEASRWRAVLELRTPPPKPGDPAPRARVVADDLNKVMTPDAVPSISAAEVAEPSPDPENELLDDWSRGRELKISLANYLAQEWGVGGARGYILRYGLDVCSRITEELDDLKRNDELGHLRNPGGFWAAFVRDSVKTNEREATKWHPNRPAID